MNNYFNLPSTSTNDLFSSNGSTTTNTAGNSNNNNNNNAGTSSNGEQQTPNSDVNSSTSFPYDVDYNRGGFPSTFDRLAFPPPPPTANKDPLMNSYSNFTMMQAAAAATISSSNSHHHPHSLHPHHQQQQQQHLQPPMHLQQHPSANDYLLPPSNGTSSWKQGEPMSSSSLAGTSGNDMISAPSMPPPAHPHHQLSSFSMAVTNPMLYYAHSWMRPGSVGKVNGNQES